MEELKSFTGENQVDLVAWCIDFGEDDKCVLSGVNVKNQEFMQVKVTRDNIVSHCEDDMLFSVDGILYKCRYATVVNFFNDMVYCELFGEDDCYDVLEDMEMSLGGTRQFSRLESKLADTFIILALDGFGYAGALYVQDCIERPEPLTFLNDGGVLEHPLWCDSKVHPVGTKYYDMETYAPWFRMNVRTDKLEVSTYAKCKRVIILDYTEKDFETVQVAGEPVEIKHVKLNNLDDLAVKLEEVL